MSCTKNNMEKFESPKKQDDTNQFSNEPTENLLSILTNLKDKKEELYNTLMSYDSDDKQLVENDYNMTLSDIQNIENEITRRATNN